VCRMPRIEYRAKTAQVMAYLSEDVGITAGVPQTADDLPQRTSRQPWAYTMRPRQPLLMPALSSQR
jgi:hypothetical protein